MERAKRSKTNTRRTSNRYKRKENNETSFKEVLAVQIMVTAFLLLFTVAISIMNTEYTNEIKQNLTTALTVQEDIEVFAQETKKTISSMNGIRNKVIDFFEVKEEQAEPETEEHVGTEAVIDEEILNELGGTEKKLQPSRQTEIYPQQETNL